MRTLLIGIIFIIVIGIGGFAYRAVIEQAPQPLACPADAKVCPDGTAVGRTGPSCTFPACPAPNITLEAADIAFVVPSGFTETPSADPDALKIYAAGSASETEVSPTIVIYRYPISASSTAQDVIHETAIGGASGLPVPPTSYSTAQLGGRQYTVVNIERFEGVVHTAYYLKRPTDVLRFDAIDHNVLDWMSPSLDATKLPAAAALRALLVTLQTP